ncbi:MAG TPA: nuclear transport factor 2 family protein [Solirubrobacteraceae bacterium]|jgi:ketosteroid isomerase-like protein|nr:nuclear transport factor 2 family protein [Solirubrobacteraceae bacterium]
MEQSDAIAVVKANSEAFSRMDVDAMMEYYAEDAVAVDCRPRVSMGTFRGHAELRPYYLSIFHSASELHETLRVVAAEGDVVVADCELRGRLAEAPARAPDVVVPYGLMLVVRDGRIVRLELHESAEDALAASGLGEASV